MYAHLLGGAAQGNVALGHETLQARARDLALRLLGVVKVDLEERIVLEKAKDFLADRLILAKQQLGHGIDIDDGGRGGRGRQVRLHKSNTGLSMCAACQ